jgi:putative FmdB family regulatory protein
MPFYEYQCKQCGHHLEAMQKVNDDPLKKCPDCGKSALQRLMSAPVFRLKGGGWYETDFKSKDEDKRNLADRPEAQPAKDDSKAATAAAAKEAPADKGEAKPAEKSADQQPAASAKKSTRRAGQKARPAKAKAKSPRKRSSARR